MKNCVFIEMKFLIVVFWPRSLACGNACYRDIHYLISFRKMELYVSPERYYVPTSLCSHSEKRGRKDNGNPWFITQTIGLQVSKYDVHSRSESKLVLYRKSLWNSACSDEKVIQVTFSIIQEWRPHGKPRRACECNIKNGY
jgi:hypothetical protein